MSKNNEINLSLNVKTENTQTNIKDLNSMLEQIPVLGNKARSVLNQIVKIPFSPAVAGISAISGGLALAYKNSQNLRNEIEKFKNVSASLNPVSKYFKALGDDLSFFVKNINEAAEQTNILNGMGLENIKNSLSEINKSTESLNNRLKASLTLIKATGEDEQEVQIRINQNRKNNAEESIYLLEEELANKRSLYQEHIRELSILISKEEQILVVDEASAIKKQQAQDKINKLTVVFQQTEKDIQTIQEQINLKIKEGVNAQEKITEIQDKKNNNVKIESDALASILARTKQINVEHRFMTKYTEDEEQITQENLKKYQSQLAIIKNINSVYNSGEKIKTATLNKIAQEFDMSVDLFKTEKGRVEIYEEILKKIKEIEEGQNKINEAMLKSVQQGYEWMGVISQVHSMSSSIASLSLSSKLIDTSIYDKAISEVKAKITEFNKWKEAMEEEEDDKEDAEFEAYLERLNKEYEIAKEIGDKMTMLAIENKKKELDKQKETLEKEKQITAQEKALEKELAIAEYNKAYAEWQNECMIAEQTKQMNLAEAIIQPLQAAAYAALGIAQSFATGGPIGAAIAAASSIGIISSAVSTAAAYKNSAQQLDSVKASPPEPPAFRFGTAGYQLKEGEQAIVGEAGAEIIKNMAGKLVVESNAQAKASGKLNGVGMYVETVIFNVNSIVDKQTIFKAMNEYKERNSFAYTR